MCARLTFDASSWLLVEVASQKIAKVLTKNLDPRFLKNCMPRQNFFNSTMGMEGVVHLLCGAFEPILTGHAVL